MIDPEDLIEEEQLIAAWDADPEAAMRRDEARARELRPLIAPREVLLERLDGTLDAIRQFIERRKNIVS